MFQFVDHLHRLPQSLTAARWSARLAGAAVAVLLARLLTLSIGEAKLPVDDQPMKPGPTVVEREPISNWHLFGAASNNDKISATSLALTLRGIVDQGDASRRMAIIAGQDQRDILYHVGDALPGGSVLDAIHSTDVVLINGGRRESLALADRQSLRQAEVAASNTPGLASETSDPSLGNANVLPVVDGPLVIGSKISTPDIAALERIGLRRDDVITSIDGRALNGPGASKELQERLRKGGDATIVLRRDGREQTQVINLGH